MGVKSKKKLYEEIEDAVAELRRQDEVARGQKDASSGVITNMEELKKHVRMNYGQGVMGFPENSLAEGKFNVASGKCIMYRAVNIIYDYEVRYGPNWGGKLLVMTVRYRRGFPQNCKNQPHERLAKGYRETGKKVLVMTVRYERGFPQNCKNQSHERLAKEYRESGKNDDRESGKNC